MDELKNVPYTYHKVKEIVLNSYSSSMIPSFDKSLYVKGDSPHYMCTLDDGITIFGTRQMKKMLILN